MKLSWAPNFFVMMSAKSMNLTDWLIEWLIWTTNKYIQPTADHFNKYINLLKRLCNVRICALNLIDRIELNHFKKNMNYSLIDAWKKPAAHLYLQTEMLGKKGKDFFPSLFSKCSFNCNYVHEPIWSLKAWNLSMAKRSVSSFAIFSWQVCNFN